MYMYTHVLQNVLYLCTIYCRLAVHAQCIYLYCEVPFTFRGYHIHSSMDSEHKSVLERGDNLLGTKLHQNGGRRERMRTGGLSLATAPVQYKGRVRLRGLRWLVEDKDEQREREKRILSLLVKSRLVQSIAHMHDIHKCAHV